VTNGRWTIATTNTGAVELVIRKKIGDQPIGPGVKADLTPEEAEEIAHALISRAAMIREGTA
jgi:hypothetical protein